MLQEGHKHTGAFQAIESAKKMPRMFSKNRLHQHKAPTMPSVQDEVAQ
jgi:hypothetical protein